MPDQQALVVRQAAADAKGAGRLLRPHVFGGDSLPTKPDPLPLLQPARRWAAAGTCTLMVGDSQNDARRPRAPAPVVLMTYGYNHGGEPVRSVDADGFADTMTAVATRRLTAQRAGGSPERKDGAGECGSRTAAARRGRPRGAALAHLGGAGARGHRWWCWVRCTASEVCGAHAIVRAIDDLTHDRRLLRRHPPWCRWQPAGLRAGHARPAQLGETLRFLPQPEPQV